LNLADERKKETKKDADEPAKKRGAGRASRAAKKEEGAPTARASAKQGAKKEGAAAGGPARSEAKSADKQTPSKPARGASSAKRAGGQARPRGKAAAAKGEAKASAEVETTPAPTEKVPAKPDEPAKPARERRQRPIEREAPARPVVRAEARYLRSSARKARLVVDHIRGKSIVDARAVLQHTPRSVARDLEKLLNSAIANAENNHDLVGDELLVKDAYADEGPTLKRFRPRARGRATRIRKRTSHVTLTLTPRE
jgi:ribosomal protein L22